MKFNVFAVIGIVWIVFVATLALSTVGTLTCAKPYVIEWWLVPEITLGVALPFIAGFLAGRAE